MAKKKSYNYDRKEDTSERLEKLRKKLQGEAEELDALDAATLRARIVECQTNLVETMREMDTDNDLLAAKSKLANIEAPYKEARTRLTAVGQYCALRLEELGKL